MPVRCVSCRSYSQLVTMPCVSPCVEKHPHTNVCDSARVTFAPHDPVFPCVSQFMHVPYLLLHKGVVLPALFDTDVSRHRCEALHHMFYDASHVLCAIAQARLLQRSRLH